MALKLVRQKKAAAQGRAKRKTNAQKFADECNLQIRTLKGETVKRGRGSVRSWLQDGTEYNVEKVLVPVVNKKPLYGKSAIQVQSRDGVPELEELKSQVLVGKLAAKVNALYKAEGKK